MLKNRPLLKNTLLLTAASLLLRAVGLLFQSFISDALGAAGVGLFALTMSASGLAITFAVGGVRYAVTRVVAEEAAKGGQRGGYAVRAAIAYAAVFSAVAAIALYFGADYIARAWVKDTRVSMALKVMAAALPLYALTSVFEGYFVAAGQVYKGVASQVAEEVVMFAAAFYLVPRVTGGIAQSCAAIVSAHLLGNAASLILCAVLYTRKHAARAQPADRGRAEFRAVGKRLIAVALPIAGSAYVRTGLSTLQHMLIPAGLRSSGLGAEAALAAHGVIHGMVFPVLLFPGVLITAAAELLIPELTAAQMSGNVSRVRRVVGRITREAFAFSLAAASAMFVFGPLIGELMFQSAEAGEYIRLLSPLVLVMYMDMITDGMLKGLGEQLYAMYVNIIDSAVSVILVWLTLPIWGINAYLFMIVATELMNFILSAAKLRQRSSVQRRIAVHP
ncbi:MAG: oligosaccharide flippase family protein [Oscillospiraceae bacterium]|jgi:stage V sporulation protein B|nr:oligosaccharide flippase family protein [Oscillospiraceae bacterium]